MTKKGPKPQDEAERFWSLVDRTGACWTWLGKRVNGYGQFRRNSPRRMEMAHRVAWELTNGSVPKGLWVLHRCDNRLCCHPDHLFVGTAQDNSDDMINKGRSKRRLTDGQIEEIRQSAEPSRLIAPRYGVTHAYIRRLRRQEKRVR
jgi:hypothetical protein